MFYIVWSPSKRCAYDVDGNATPYMGAELFDTAKQAERAARCIGGDARAWGPLTECELADEWAQDCPSSIAAHELPGLLQVPANTLAQ